MRDTGIPDRNRGVLPLTCPCMSTFCCRSFDGSYWAMGFLEDDIKVKVLADSTTGLTEFREPGLE